MFFVCDDSDYLKVGVKDTTDGCIEYYSRTQLVEMLKRGIDIAGVSPNGCTTCYDDNSCYEWYCGDLVGAAVWDTFIVSLADNTKGTHSNSPRRFGSVYTIKSIIDNTLYPGVRYLYDIVISRYTGTQIEFQRIESKKGSQRILPDYSERLSYDKLGLIVRNSIYSEYDYLFESQYFGEVKYSVQSSTGCVLLQRSLNVNDKILRVLLYNLGDGFVNMTIEEFYTQLSKGNLTCHNASLTQNGFEYSGLDGCYSIDMNKINNAFKRFLAGNEMQRVARSTLLKKGVSGVLANGQLERAIPDKNGEIIIPDTCTTIDFAAFQLDSTLKKLEIPASCVNTLSSNRGYSYYYLHNFVDSNTKLVYKSSSLKVLKALDSWMYDATIDFENSKRAVVLAYLISVCSPDTFRERSGGIEKYITPAELLESLTYIVKKKLNNYRCDAVSLNNLYYYTHLMNGTESRYAWFRRSSAFSKANVMENILIVVTQLAEIQKIQSQDIKTWEKITGIAHDVNVFYDKMVEIIKQEVKSRTNRNKR